MIKKVLYVLLAIHAILIGLYPSIYFFTNGRFGILGSKSDALLSNVFWNAEFYTHISLGGLALAIGWTQFNTKWRTNKLSRHRLIGKVYVVAALVSAQAAIYIAFYAQGGMIASLGFLCLGIIWFYTTGRAYIEIRNRRTTRHQKMMIYSYAACIAAITLRMYLYPLRILLHDFTKAYQLVAWLCWVPNLVVAYFLVRRVDRREHKTVTDKSRIISVADPAQHEQLYP